MSPRKPASNWSAVNVRRALELIETGRMRPAGLKAFEARRENRSGKYSYEQRTAGLDEPCAGLVRKDEPARMFFQAQPAGYRKVVSWRVHSAKREETRLRRLEKLIAYSAWGQRLWEATSPKRRG